jgi:hypothetical protein
MYKKQTRDEAFLALLYTLAKKRGDPSTAIDHYEVGRAMNLSVRMTDSVVRHAAQANFIKKGDDNAIYLTPYGVRWVEEQLFKERAP